MYISGFRVNSITGLVTGVAAGEQGALYGQEAGARHCDKAVALPAWARPTAPQ